jgi:large subunit ribosomal protein L13
MVNKTFSAKSDEVERSWHLIDLNGKTVGRVATEIAKLLRGKHKPIFTPHVDCGDFVVCINAEKVVFTGNKNEEKRYYRHSGYPGGIRSASVNEVLSKHPERIIENAVRGMLPKNPLGRQIGRKLKVYAGESHPHTAQNPQPYEL